MHYASDHQMEKKRINLLSSIWLLLLIKVVGGVPTTYKRSLLYHGGGNYNWHDSVKFCYDRGGYLINIQSETVVKAINYFQSSSSTSGWQNNWNNDMWTALYVDTLTSTLLLMKMQGVCQTYDYVNDYSPWDSDTPSASNSDKEKKCIKMNQENKNWVMEKCSQLYSFICEINLGECTFEHVTGTRCADTYSSPLMKTVSSKDDCMNYCRSLTIDSNLECWAITFDSANGNCYPSMEVDPFAFKSAESCGEFNNPTLSFKRCFEAIDVTGSTVPSVALTMSNVEPHPICNFTDPTILATTAMKTIGTKMQQTTTTTAATTTTETTSTQNPTLTTTTASTTSNPSTTTVPESTTTTTIPRATTTVESTSQIGTTTPQTTLTEPTTDAETTITSVGSGTTTDKTTQQTTTTIATTTSPGETSTTAMETTPQKTLTEPSTTTDASVNNEPTTEKTTQQTTTIIATTTSPEETSTSKLMTTATATNMVTDSVINISVAPGCSCSCSMFYNITTDELLKNIRNNLIIDAKNTSSARRKLISVKDMRTSTNAIGGLANIILFALLALFLSSDALRFFTWLKNKIFKKHELKHKTSL